MKKNLIPVLALTCFYALLKAYEITRLVPAPIELTREQVEEVVQLSTLDKTFTYRVNLSKDRIPVPYLDLIDTGSIQVDVSVLVTYYFDGLRVQITPTQIIFPEVSKKISVKSVSLTREHVLLGSNAELLQSAIVKAQVEASKEACKDGLPVKASERMITLIDHLVQELKVEIAQSIYIPQSHCSQDL